MLVRKGRMPLICFACRYLVGRPGKRPPFDLKRWLDSMDMGDYEDNFRSQGYDRREGV